MALGNLIPMEFLGMADVYKVIEGQDRNARSPFEELLDQIRQHEDEEEIVLEDYERLAATTPDPGVRYLVNLIAQDERRHHALAKDIAQDMTRSLMWAADSGRELPTVRATGAERDELLVKTRKYLHLEAQGLTTIEHLEPKVRELRSGMVELLFVIMAADTKKHIQILKYIEKHLEAAA
jgi:rubrerythrin